MRKKSKGSDKPSKSPGFSWKFFGNILLAGVLVFLIFSIWEVAEKQIKNSELFRIKSIKVVDPSMQFIKSSRMINLKGRNIFAVDLNTLAARLQTEYPEIAEIRLLKRFPDQILIATKKRFPFALAQVKGKTVIIDSQGIILSPSAINPAEYPLVLGVAAEKLLVSPGIQLKGEDITTALNIIKTFRMNKYLSIYKILRIDVSNLSQIEFNLTESLKVIMDQSNVPERIQLLSLMLSPQTKLQLDEVDYIDLRFQEPITHFIGKKTANK